MSEYENSDGGTGGTVDVRSLSADELVAAMDRERLNPEGIDDGGPGVADDVLAGAWEAPTSESQYYPGTMAFEWESIHRDSGMGGQEAQQAVYSDMQEAGELLKAAGAPAWLGKHILSEVTRSLKAPMDDGAREAAAHTSETELRREWGENFDRNLQVARGALNRLNPEQRERAVRYLDESGLGDNPYLIRTLFNMMQTRGGRG